jgi:glycosyl transferase family 25
MSSNLINHIFYINLEKRGDRKKHIEEQLKKYDLEFLSERYEAINTPHSGIIGCSFSHLNVLKLARERGYKNVLILEDDFEFVVSKEEFENTITEFFNSQIKYDVLMISYIIQKSEDVAEYPFIKKIIDGQTAAGYIVSCDYYDTLIKLYEETTVLLEKTNAHWLYANDICWKKLQPEGNWYFTTQPLGRQRADYSDNKMCFVNY